MRYNFSVFNLFFLLFIVTLNWTTSEAATTPPPETSCSEDIDADCDDICAVLRKAYDTTTSPGVTFGCWVLIVILLAEMITAVVLFMKDREMKKQTHLLEVNLSNLKKVQEQNERVHAEQMLQDSIDADPAKFTNKGNITIATNLDEAFKQRCDDKNVVLQTVEYDETGNEQFDVGDDVDKFESQKSHSSRQSSAKTANNGSGESVNPNRSPVGTARLKPSREES